MRATTCWLAVSVVAGLLGACRSTPDQPLSPPSAAQCHNPQLESLGNYALRLRQQDAVALTEERDRLEAATPTPDRDLRLALLLGQYDSPAYDPERAARLLVQLSSSAPPDSPYKSVAEMLFTSLPGGPRRWTDSDEYRELAAQLSVEQQKRQETATRLETVRQELDAERTQREKLEQQLDALKSLEEQIKNRDNETAR